MKLSIPNVSRFRRWWAVLPAVVLVAVLGCRDDANAPTGPAEEATFEQAAATAAAAISFNQLTTGNAHTCGINANNRLYCWGANGFGQLGDGTTSSPRLRPVLVATTLRFRGVAASEFGTCAITTEDRLFCWGSTSGSVTPITQPQAVGTRRYRNVSPSLEHVCAIGRDDGRAYCWGSNRWGQLGDGTTTSHSTPAPVAGSRRFKQVATGERHSCGLTTGDEIFCWGANQWGQLGFESDRFVLQLVPREVAGTRQYINLTAGRFHTCAVTLASKGFCWGDGRNHQIGDGKRFLRFEPRAVAGGLTFRRLTAGYSHTCGETTDNRAYCWGSDLFGAQGDGQTEPFGDTNELPTAVVGGLRFAQLSAGRNFTCGKTTANVGYCWGENGGQLGDGTQTNRSRPTAIVGPS